MSIREKISQLRAREAAKEQSKNQIDPEVAERLNREKLAEKLALEKRIASEQAQILVNQVPRWRQLEELGVVEVIEELTGEKIRVSETGEVSIEGIFDLGLEIDAETERRRVEASLSKDTIFAVQGVALANLPSSTGHWDKSIYIWVAQIRKEGLPHQVQHDGYMATIEYLLHGRLDIRGGRGTTYSGFLSEDPARKITIEDALARAVSQPCDD